MSTDYRKNPDPKAQLAAAMGKSADGAVERVNGKMTITIHCAAIGKPRMTRSDKWKKRPCVVRYREWCDALRSVAGPVPDPSSIVEVKITATFACKGKAKSGDYHRVKPDNDNICKGVLDCLFEQDQKIPASCCYKFWGDSDSLRIEILCE